MDEIKNDPEADSPGSAPQLPMDPPAVSWQSPASDSWLCTALSELPRAIQRLSAAERAAVIGYYFDERPIDELAASLQMEPARVQVILQQALRELRRRVPH